METYTLHFRENPGRELVRFDTDGQYMIQKDMTPEEMRQLIYDLVPTAARWYFKARAFDKLIAPF